MRVHTSLIDRLLEPYMRRFLVRHEQAQRWTTAHCPACNSPVAFDGAAYCAFCGVSLVKAESSPKPVEPIQRPVEEQAIVTDALYRLNQRPLQSFVAARQQGAGIHTALSVAIDVEKLRKQGKGKP